MAEWRMSGQLQERQWGSPVNMQHHYPLQEAVHHWDGPSAQPLVGDSSWRSPCLQALGHCAGKILCIHELGCSGLLWEGRLGELHLKGWPRRDPQTIHGLWRGLQDPCWGVNSFCIAASVVAEKSAIVTWKLSMTKEVSGSNVVFVPLIPEVELKFKEKRIDALFHQRFPETYWFSPDRKAERVRLPVRLPSPSNSLNKSYRSLLWQKQRTSNLRVEYLIFMIRMDTTFPK